MSAACAAWREQWDVDGCVRYVLARGFTRVTLQFPDELQAHAADVAAALQAGCAAAGATVQAFVLADTTYQATAVDEVAALHVDAHCIVRAGPPPARRPRPPRCAPARGATRSRRAQVHYGRASLSALSRLPAYFVFGRAPAAPAALAAAVAAHAAGLAGARAVVVLLDQPLLWAAPALRAALDAAPPGPAGGGGGAAVVLADAAARQLEPGPRAAPPPGRTALAGYCWQLPAGVQARPGRSPVVGSVALVFSACAARWPSAGAAGGPGLTEGRLRAGGRGRPQADECAWLWVGEGDAPALAQLQLTAPDARWAALDAAGGALVEGLPAALRAALRRRRFLVEKARAASIVGAPAAARAPGVRTSVLRRRPSRSGCHRLGL